MKKELRPEFIKEMKNIEKNEKPHHVDNIDDLFELDDETYIPIKNPWINIFPFLFVHGILLKHILITPIIPFHPKKCEGTGIEKCSSSGQKNLMWNKNKKDKVFKNNWRFIL